MTHKVTEGIQHRDIPATLEVREDADGKREVAGIGVPFNSPIDIYGVREQFAPGSVQPSEGTKLFWRHSEPIGKVVESSNKDDGWHHRAVISKTPLGDEAYTLAKDGVVDRFSVGFEPIEHLEEKADDGTVTITHTKVRVREVSLVPFPAYDDAKLTSVRAAEPSSATTEDNTMGNENREQDGNVATIESVDELRGAVDELTRRVEVGLTRTDEDAGHTTGARSFGEFVQLIAAGDEQATRAYTGAVSDDFVLEDQWIGSLVEILHKRQTVASTFARGALPAKGLTVEYAELDSDSTDVDEQSNEGDDLSFGKVSVTTKTARETLIY